MSNSLVQKISGLLGVGGKGVAVADVAMSSGGLAMTYGATSGVAAYFDFGANIYTKGAYKVRFKSVGGFSAASQQIGLVVAQDSAFATKQLVAVLPCVSAVATLAAPSTVSFAGLFDNDPTTFRYARWENIGVALGSTPCTLDTEIVALP